MTTTRCRAKNPATCRQHGNKTFAFQPANITPERHHQESQKFAFLLTQTQQQALQAYLDVDYMDITPVLYGTSDYNEEKHLKQAKHIQTAINNYEQISDKTPKTVYRATKLNHQQPPTSIQEMETLVKTKYPIGGTITTQGFTSTTVNPVALFHFMPEGYQDYRINNPNRTHTHEEYIQLMGQDESLNNIIYEITTPSGAPVSALGHTHAEEEQEYLLGRNKTFTITGVLPYQKIDHPAPTRRWKQQAHATIIQLQEVTE